LTCIYIKIALYSATAIKYTVNIEQLIDQGNQHRADGAYEQALQCYATAFVADRNSASAFNNYGNVLREMGYPRRAVPFIESAIDLAPANITAQFNLAVCLLLMGDYGRGWPQYETRWHYEHLAGTMPRWSQPRWQGEDLQGKTILVVGEQGHGDNIQFVRFADQLRAQGAQVKLQVTDGLVELLAAQNRFAWTGGYNSDPGAFDFWTPIMSIPGVLNIGLDQLPAPQTYIAADHQKVRDWAQRLGPKTRMRVGFCWSGRRDSWLNQHKAVPFESMCELIHRNPEYQWINLQIDAEPEQEAVLESLGVSRYPGTVQSFADTAALMQHLDVVVGVDTAVSHLAAATGRPTWIMLNRYSTDWRWLLERSDSPWYPTVRLFRQPNYGEWRPVLDQVTKFLGWFKI
jgi:tetratricopeptide (TPR) repeat protein